MTFIIQSASLSLHDFEDDPLLVYSGALPYACTVNVLPLEPDSTSLSSVG